MTGPFDTEFVLQYKAPGEEWLPVIFGVSRDIEKVRERAKEVVTWGRLRIMRVDRTIEEEPVT